MGIKINWATPGAPLWTVEKKPKKLIGPEADALSNYEYLLVTDGFKTENLHTKTVFPEEAVRQIRNLVKEIALRKVDSLALKAYAVALSAQTKVIARLNREPELVSMVYLDEATGLPLYSNTEADLMTFCQMFEPEPMLKAILDSFSGWSILGTQKFEGCRCGDDSVNLELKIRLHHSHEIKDGRFFIEQLLGVESDNQAHLEKHYGGFSQKSKAQENILIVAVSKISIRLSDEYDQHEFQVEEERHSDQINIGVWRNILENLSIQGHPLDTRDALG